MYAVLKHDLGIVKIMHPNVIRCSPPLWKFEDPSPRPKHRSTPLQNAYDYEDVYSKMKMGTPGRVPYDE